MGVATRSARWRAPPRVNAAAVVRVAPPSRAAQGCKSAANEVAFASVVVASPTCEERSRRVRSGAPMIEVVVGGLTVRVPPGADPAMLQVVLRAARAVS